MKSFNKLNLIKEELDIISKTARDIKFKNFKDEFIYPNTYKEKLKSFVKSYRFIQSLHSNLVGIESNQNIVNKLYLYYNQLTNLYNESEFLLNQIKPEIHFGNNIVEYKIKNLVYENNIIINQVIDDIFPIGRVISSYNPDQEVGVS